jgi:hypothetical protein
LSETGQNREELTASNVFRVRPLGACFSRARLSMT